MINSSDSGDARVKIEREGFYAEGQCLDYVTLKENL